MSDWLQKFVFVSGSIVFLLVAGVNARLTIGYAFGRIRSGSRVPLVGGCAGCLGLLLGPWPQLRAWCWVPLLLDLGCLPMVAQAAWWWLRERWAPSRGS